MRKEFKYVCSSELDVPLRIRVVSLLEFNSNLLRLCELSGCILLRVTVFCNRRYVARDIQASFRSSSHSSSNREIQKWNEWLTLPICYSELSRDALLHISIWDITDSIKPVFFAQCSKTLFSKHGIYRSGQIDLRMKRSMQYTSGQPQSQDAKEDKRDITTNYCGSQYFRNHPEIQLMDQSSSTQPVSELVALLKKIKLYSQKLIERSNWLDKITFSKLEERRQEAKIEDRSLYLTIEMPTVFHTDDVVPYSILFFMEDEYQSVIVNPAVTRLMLISSIQLNSGSREPNRTSPIGSGHSEYWVDPELGMDNLCEAKHHMLTRNTRANNIDWRLQPNPATREAIETIINASSQVMSMEDRDLIWKFRFWLKSNPNALVKFIRSVNWEEEAEVQHAIQVILEWEPIDTCDALELLTPSFTHSFVRHYAVSRLQHTTYANILLYLPQLVQALRYESRPISNIDMLFVTDEMTSNLVSSHIDNDEKFGPTTPLNSTSKIGLPLVNHQQSDGGCEERVGCSSSLICDYFGPDSDLASFLIRAACDNSIVANFLYWYLKVEVEANQNIDEPIAKMFASMIDRLKSALSKGNYVARQTLATLSQQKKFVDTLVEMARFAAETSGSRARKLELLKKKLSENHDLMDLKGLSLPLDPSIHVKNVHAESTILFSSNLMPMRLTFSTVHGSVTPYECGEAYTTIFKRGDDLRQDQLVIQMIRLIDSLLKEEKLDLCLTPYAVLATSVSEGFVQFIKATPIADLKSIQETLRTFRPSATGPYGIEAGVLNNYVRSCAGYSVICYILGIGDRHLHNLLLCENGRMFHVDFGFILGRDPKPMPAPMKLTSEMINAMGGQNSQYFKDFVDYITTAFCILRRHANLIINLFSLMLDAGIPDIAVEKEKTVQKVLERFHLQLSDESACQLMNRLIETSMSAKMPILIDLVHDMKQFISN